MFPRPEINPHFEDPAPTEPFLAPYDYTMMIAYLHLLDGHEDKADWKEVSGIVLHRDSDTDPLRTKRSWKSHLVGAGWMTHTRLSPAAGIWSPLTIPCMRHEAYDGSA